MQKKGFIAGVKDALPTALGYISIGLAFGIVAAAANLSALEVGLMSLLVYGGSAQFAMVAMFVAQADLVTITMTVFFINLRNMLMSLHATTIFTETSFWNSMGIASLITDESYGVLLGENIHNKNISDNWMHGNNLFSYFAWVVSTIIGTLLGNIIPNPESFGLDFALIAMFIGLWIDQVASMLSEGAKKLILILLAVAISYVVLVTVVSESLAVLLATLIGCGVGVILDGYY
ncbi:AzlC family ABC transporter permease [Streptococcus dentapri]|uniref:AzlC family ABC transporter permease n=1 Tax=Streptococcus dentapri TaxID=573564 RepID=A0ABV8CYH2_9STRE